jgi:hypothetical protein
MRIFISHSQSDAAAARRLAEELEQAGHEPWVAESQILPGDNWAEVVGRALSDAEAMVILLTPDALRSEWVRREISYALANERFEGRLFPVSVGPADRLAHEQVPWVLNSFHWLSLDAGQEDEAARQIADALSQAVA